MTFANKHVRSLLFIACRHGSRLRVALAQIFRMRASTSLFPLTQWYLYRTLVFTPIKFFWSRSILKRLAKAKVYPNSNMKPDNECVLTLNGQILKWSPIPTLSLFECLSEKRGWRVVGLVEFVEHVGLVGLVGCNILAPEPHFRQLIAKLWVTLLTVVTWSLGDQCNA